MADSMKIFAPKPVKRSANLSGVKLNLCSRDINRDNPFTSSHPNLYTDNLVRFKHSSKNLHTSSNAESFINRNNKISKSGKFNDLEGKPFEDDVMFEKNVEKDFHKLKINDDESQFKSEILSILRSESTAHDSYLYRSVNFNLEKEEQDELDVPESDRISMPPIRSSNPLYKNFELENFECVECNYNNFIHDEKYEDNNYNDNFEDDFYFNNLGEFYEPK